MSRVHEGTTPNGTSVDVDGVRIAYDDRTPDGESGTESPIVLVHGFASSRTDNRRDRGWYETLLEADETETMAADAVVVLDHLDVEATDALRRLPSPVATT